MSKLKTRRKSEIIESAIVVFGTRGFHRGKMEDIAHGAGLGKGTVYEYFESKNDLLNQVIIYLLISYSEIMKEIAYCNSDIKSKIEKMMEKSQEFLDENSNIIKEMIFQNKNVSKDLQKEIEALHVNVFELIFELIDEGMESGDIRKDLDKRAVGFMLANTIVGFNNASNLYRRRYDLSSKYIVNLLFNGIK